MASFLEPLALVTKSKAFLGEINTEQAWVKQNHSALGLVYLLDCFGLVERIGEGFASCKDFMLQTKVELKGLQTKGRQVGTAANHSIHEPFS